MCFGGHSDNGQQETNMILMNMLQQQQQTSAQATAQADAASQKAQDTIASDEGLVNNAFGQFNPQYFQNYQKAYTDYYTPQLTDQYAQAKDQLTAALAQNGTLESTVGAHALGNLAQADANQAAAIQGQANNASTQLQQQISNEQTALNQQAAAAVDPTQLASSAQAQTTALAAPPSYSPLGQVFGDYVTPFQNYTKSAAAAPAAGMMIPQVQTANAYSQGGGGSSSPITG